MCQFFLRQTIDRYSQNAVNFTGALGRTWQWVWNCGQINPSSDMVLDRAGLFASPGKCAAALFSWLMQVSWYSICIPALCLALAERSVSEFVGFNWLLPSPNQPAEARRPLDHTHAFCKLPETSHPGEVSCFTEEVKRPDSNRSSFIWPCYLPALTELWGWSDFHPLLGRLADDKHNIGVHCVLIRGNKVARDLHYRGGCML